MDDIILKSYLQKINDKNRESLVIDQLQIIKQLVNRKTFRLTDRQITLVNKKF